MTGAPRDAESNRATVPRIFLMTEKNRKTVFLALLSILLVNDPFFSMVIFRGIRNKSWIIYIYN